MMSINKQINEIVKKNNELEYSITHGYGHVYYGLAIAFILDLFVIPFMPLVGILILIIIVGVFVDLYAHDYLH